MTYSDFILNNIIFFTIFVFILTSLLLTISQKNPVNAILFLIFFFFNVSILFIYCGADYLGILFLMLYAGAISIILLFVVMFLNLKDLLIQKVKYASIFYVITFLLFFLCLCTYLYYFYIDVNFFIPTFEPPFN